MRAEPSDHGSPSVVADEVRRAAGRAPSPPARPLPWAPPLVCSQLDLPIPWCQVPRRADGETEVQAGTAFPRSLAARPSRLPASPCPLIVSESPRSPSCLLCIRKRRVTHRKRPGPLGNPSRVARKSGLLRLAGRKSGLSGLHGSLLCAGSRVTPFPLRASVSQFSGAE